MSARWIIVGIFLAVAFSLWPILKFEKFSEARSIVFEPIGEFLLTIWFVAIFVSGGLVVAVFYF